VLRVNKEFTRIFGYTAEEVVGQWLPDLIVPEELRAEALKNRDRLSSGNKLSWRPFGNAKTVFALTLPLWQRAFARLRAVGIYLIYRDISERKKAERKLRRSEANLLEAKDWCICAVGRTTVIWDGDVLAGSETNIRYQVRSGHLCG